MLEAVRMEDQVEVNCAKKLAMCLIGCLLSCLETLMEYFNQFGFVYVAIYGYNYMKSCNVKMKNTSMTKINFP